MLPTLNSKISLSQPNLKNTLKPVKEQPKQRTRVYKFKEKKQVHAKANAYSIPETKYDIDTLQEVRIQYLIVHK